VEAAVFPPTSDWASIVQTRRSAPRSSGLYLSSAAS